MKEGERPPLNRRLAPFGTSVFTEMTRLAIEHRAVNLGQGFPDFDGPEFVKEAAIAAIRAGENQYSRSFGVPELNRAVAEHRRRFYGLEYDPDREVSVFAGATEAIFSSIQALCEPGDEVIVFDPAYDSYRPSIALAGATVRTVARLPPLFELTREALDRAVTPRTRLVVINTPHNPTGKVFTRAELESIAALCRERKLIAVTDEVYEHLVFDTKHVPLATLPGMRERTVMISSSGKSFGVTGWKIGFACAPPGISAAIRAAHQFITFCSTTPFQHAIAAALIAPDEYFSELERSYRARRDLLCEGLEAAGFEVRPPAGTYFAVADIRPLGFEDGDTFCRELPARSGVAAIPVGAFCEDPLPVRHLVRFAFCKTEATIREALSRLRRLKGH